MEIEQSTTSNKQLVFAKIEKIIRGMQHADHGIPTRPQKVFLTSVPCAFTGIDLIEWITKLLDVHSTTEATHLATLLSQYGYIYPVEATKTVSIKEDNTLHRFQSPYFWTSQDRSHDNTDYALYLAKRTMRNKQNFGLEEYENTAYSNLQRMLGHKWEFILLQAQEQLRLAKHRKKADRIVLDAQERAFWRVHYPPPGQTNCLEADIRRKCKNSQPARTKKPSPEEFKKQVTYLQNRLSKMTIKTSKAIDVLIRYCERFAEHDPFISGAQPSNPWISDDTTMWTLNTMLVDTPTERRVRRWAISFRELLSDVTGKHEFEKFLQKEYSQENIRFWSACETLKYAPQSMVPEMVHEIYRTFLAPGAPCEINVDGRTMELTQQSLRKPNRFAFEAAQQHIFLLMKKDSYQRFLKSDTYKGLLARAMQNGTKRKFFTFGGRFLRSAKVTPDVSPLGYPRRGSLGTDISDSLSDRPMTHSLSASNLQDFELANMYNGTENGHKTEEVYTSVKSSRFASLQPMNSTNLKRHGSLGGVEHSGKVLNGNKTKRMSETQLDLSFLSYGMKTTTKKNLITPWEEDMS
ncbi:regulator of G-protein signaling 9 [Strongylocentrotus purpuratus]|uniref:Regulator of G-protein signaling 7 n=1 Tax=Strongylocentrotus purpuratus TaxID=7668 RepID=A0A7M7NSL9_STRPU|nr:regulator of G-protein signaling 9 [Strongylocentrotus purpuratus]